MRTTFLSILIVLASPAGAEREAASPPTHATVLLYHKFDEPEHPTTNIQSWEFREQLEYLRDNGYTVLSMEAFCRHLDERDPFPAKSVLITIDDPYRSIFRVARPILREFGYPWTLFVWTKGVEDGYRGMMSWSDIEQLAAEGVAIGNHTHTHPYLGIPARGETADEYMARVFGEVRTAQALLRAHRLDSGYIAFPYGHYNNVIVDAARAAGYRYHFTQDPGAADERTSVERIPRAAIVGAEQEMKDFRYRLSLSPLHVSDVTPPYGFLESNPPRAFGLRLLDPGRYHTGVVNMFVSEWGRTDAAYDAETGELQFLPDRRLSRKMNRMIVTARDRTTGTFSMYAEMILRPFQELTGSPTP